MKFEADNPIFCIQPDWPAPFYINAVVSTRKGGVSALPYAALNLGHNTGDLQENIHENRRRLVHHLNISTPWWLQQTHGTDMLCLRKNSKLEGTRIADAAFTNDFNQTLAILTADCLPILICSQKTAEIAAIHAGWRGLSQKIIEKTVCQFKSSPAHLLAWLGPAISQSYYEVKADVYEHFINQNASYKKAFISISEDKWLLDLLTIAIQQLEYAGIKQIYGGQHCTYKSQEHFFSFRRDQGNTGRMAALIWMT